MLFSNCVCCGQGIDIACRAERDHGMLSQAVLCNNKIHNNTILYCSVLPFALSLPLCLSICLSISLTVGARVSCKVTMDGVQDSPIPVFSIKTAFHLHECIRCKETEHWTFNSVTVL